MNSPRSCVEVLLEIFVQKKKSGRTVLIFIDVFSSEDTL